MEAELSDPCTLPAVLSLALPQFMPYVSPRGLKCAHTTFALGARGLRNMLPRVVFDSPAPQRTTIAMAKAISGELVDHLRPPYSAPSAAEVHHGGNAARSCRLCLIACNSRQIDAQECERD
jgi:hypothetical protein